MATRPGVWNFLLVVSVPRNRNFTTNYHNKIINFNVSKWLIKRKNRIWIKSKSLDKVTNNTLIIDWITHTTTAHEYKPWTSLLLLFFFQFQPRENFFKFAGSEARCFVSLRDCPKGGVGAKRSLAKYVWRRLQKRGHDNIDIDVTIDRQRKSMFRSWKLAEKAFINFQEIDETLISMSWNETHRFDECWGCEALLGFSPLYTLSRHRSSLFRWLQQKLKWLWRGVGRQKASRP